MPYIATIGFYRISQKCGASRALLCFYKLGFNCSCNRKTRQIMCIHECACSCNKIICIIHLLYLDVLQAFAEPRVSGFAIIVGKGVRKQNEYVFNKFIYFYIIFSLQWLKQTFCWFQFHSASPSATSLSVWILWRWSSNTKKQQAFSMYQEKKKV